MNRSVIILLFISAAAACRREPAGGAPLRPASTRPAAAATSTAIQDLSTANAHLTIVPVQPAFVRNISVTKNDTLQSSGTIDVASGDRLVVHAAIGAAPAGLALRAEIVSGTEKPVWESSRPVAAGSNVDFPVDLTVLKTAPAQLRIWSGGDLIFQRELKRSK